jgi:hypothetical protein
MGERLYFLEVSSAFYHATWWDDGCAPKECADVHNSGPCILLADPLTIATLVIAYRATASSPASSRASCHTRVSDIGNPRNSADACHVAHLPVCHLSVNCSSTILPAAPPCPCIGPRRPRALSQCRHQYTISPSTGCGKTERATFSSLCRNMVWACGMCG